MRWTVVLGLAAAMIAASGCKKQQEDSNVILIGHVASITGDTATFGTSADKGIKLALDEINKAGPVLGKSVDVKTEDDRSVNEEARTACEKLISRDHVCSILGEIASSRSIAMAPACQDARIPMLSPGSTNPKVTQMGDYIFRACFIDQYQGAAMAHFVVDTLKAKKYAVLYAANSDYSVGLKDFFNEAATKLGAEPTQQLSYTEKSDVDFSSQLTKIRDTNPEAIIVTGYYSEAGQIAKQARQLGIKVPLVGGDGWDSDELLKIGGDALNGCYFANHYAPDEDRPAVKEFVAAFKAKYNGEVPDAMAILGYDAMKLMVDAIKRAGSTEGPKIRDALTATKDFPGAAGNITIDKDRNAKKPIVIVGIDNSKLHFVASVNPQ
ncbi:MAG TPA: ABC transporter substrate-binding protein [Tepidisphaeraceae bacterium]|nr:ABC transporter substrate-binding protein [Tepidisphaeraceae bacterium]